jgi:hypothetical protein
MSRNGANGRLLICERGEALLAGAPNQPMREAALPCWMVTVVRTGLSLAPSCMTWTETCDPGPVMVRAPPYDGAYPG